jgi:uncharacterized UBP type Zn finger protein
MNGSRPRLNGLRAERAVAANCSHLDSIQFNELPESIAGCEEWLASGGWWVHLRMCQTCGHIGCCDDKPSKHASAHFRNTRHPIMRSAEPGEDWSYCHVDDIAFVLNR